MERHGRFTRDLDSLVRGLTPTQAKNLVIDAIETELDDGLWFGLAEAEEILEQGEYGGLRVSVSFQIGDPPQELRKQKKLEDYLAFCAKRGEIPEKPFSGTLVIRIEPSLQRKLSIAAKMRKLSLNTLIQERLAS